MRFKIVITYYDNPRPEKCIQELYYNDLQLAKDDLKRLKWHYKLQKVLDLNSIGADRMIRQKLRKWIVEEDWYKNGITSQKYVSFYWTGYYAKLLSMQIEHHTLTFKPKQYNGL